MCFSKNAIKYFCDLEVRSSIQNGVDIINPYENDEVKSIVNKFYSKFFKDNNKRLFVFGINPGRFGGGLTGISFTDPVALREHCGIENDLGERKELSSRFIYDLISAFEGAGHFYSNVFLSALYPFALVKDGKNFNYYDDKHIFEKLKPEIINSLREQSEFGARREKVIILGKKNAEYFKIINDEFNFFNEIIVLDHPRFIMQYRQRLKNKYITNYIRAIR